MKLDFNNPDIKFYFSFQCPYSYMAWTLLKKLLSNSKTTIAPIEIGLFPTGNTKFHFREIWGEPRWNRLIEDALKLGIRISRPEKYVSGLNAARAIEAYGPANAEDYITSVFRGVFFSRIDISLPNSLRLHLQSEGLDSSTFFMALEDPKTEEKAKHQQLLWGLKRIREVPTIEYDQERYSGFMDQIGIERFMRAILD
ncbi:MAG: hypothetical protein Kow0029_29380 [Candidatus Rifleibacteriota bacterium]